MSTNNRKIYIFDTTLRDGEQCPGASLTPDEKVEVAKQLERLNVDIIEAGFPAASPGEIEAIQKVSKVVRTPIICGLARMVEKDIDAVRQALRFAKRKRLHVFLATSKIHRDFKLHKDTSEILKLAVRNIRYGKKFFDDIEFSPEDASRTERDFLVEVVGAAVEAGATTVNIPDTVGYALPTEFGQLIAYLVEQIPALGKTVNLSVHCHNDLGLAVANSLSAIQNGANQVECTVNGIGERAGNAAMEEIVMTLNTRKDNFSDNCYTDVKTKEITKASRLVSRLTGMVVQPNKAIVGRNAFSHESGIHQDGILKLRQTYEIIDPKDVGLSGSQLILGKHSGRHAFRERLEKLNFHLSVKQIDVAFKRFKDLADQKKYVFDQDIEALVEEQISKIPETWQLVYLNTSSGTKAKPKAEIHLKRQKKVYKASSSGDGQVDACYKAIEKILKMKLKLVDYSIQSVTSGKDAVGEVNVKLLHQNREVSGRGTSTDVIEASVKAYLFAVNKICSQQIRTKLAPV
ncbi:MAG: 2-isopropylmalate synthase [Candidatus Omnitrophica bacterium CG11_big_fil_rev_8_21_14_0_20_45_26]|uniref:2-isopropylmalate synthase n=1 Tax=Candidatus Abzuiibacterium crystallinum TaxID=1974748 RepID=A0A2H0LMJ3_9BACT|nr:MAG: 2-isopropylmalate synthase [Candidatus Omnitrophica bacterium CG11_big_fil_rev_8_21_14_0_20_45_26]PIW65160.1 MAG: 2-isopropylmalate synthase [Candidatus Omnitrophica bacterium CG12_big_fil_rev_8_21_14_0_65_45_16]